MQAKTQSIPTNTGRSRSPVAVSAGPALEDAASMDVDPPEPSALCPAAARTDVQPEAIAAAVQSVARSPRALGSDAEASSDSSTDSEAAAGHRSWTNIAKAMLFGGLVGPGMAALIAYLGFYDDHDLFLVQHLPASLCTGIPLGAAAVGAARAMYEYQFNEWTPQAPHSFC
ncbi:hypothetical protein [Hydrogenophaga borbori]|nr:hypothetical protein [Hydrogenophaga borbori]